MSIQIAEQFEENEQYDKAFEQKALRQKPEGYEYY